MMNAKQLSLGIMLTTLLAGCAMPPPMPAPHPTRPQAGMDANALLARARQSQPIQAAELRLQAARQLIRAGETSQAQQILTAIDTRDLPPGLQFDILKLQTQDALARQEPAQALGYLAYMPTLDSLPQEQISQGSQLYAQVYHSNNQPLDEALILIESTQYVHQPEQRQTIHDQIWAALQTTDSATLQQALQQPNNSYLIQGWLELAQAARTPLDISSVDPASQIDNWLLLWESHPAALLKPGSLTAPALSADLLQVARLAVLLPESGPLAPAAIAIRRGLEAAHHANQADYPPPELIFIDSSALTTAEQLLTAVQDSQAELIIGPLDKDKVSTLATLPLAQPILALNAIEQSAANLFQYALSIEDEARDAATRAIQQDHRFALIITPESEWGIRAATAFRQHFTALGGVVVAQTQFNQSNLNDKIRQLLNTDASQQRASQLRRITGLNFEFQERRRQDADVILLAARPQHARLIKPLLNFYFAADLPIYATSQVYSGIDDPRADTDLNGIMFGDTPWLLAPPSALHNMLKSRWQDTDTRYGRLYAMGIDAYNLYPYLHRLKVTPGSHLKGETGQLSINHLGQINRQLTWAIFKSGSVQLLPDSPTAEPLPYPDSSDLRPTE